MPRSITKQLLWSIFFDGIVFAGLNASDFFDTGEDMAVVVLRSSFERVRNATKMPCRLDLLRNGASFLSCTPECGRHIATVGYRSKSVYHSLSG